MCVGWQVGSIFEFANRNPIFGVLPPDNFLWAPILLFFSITGFPSAGACPQSLANATMPAQLTDYAKFFDAFKDVKAMQHSQWQNTILQMPHQDLESFISGLSLPE